MIYQKQSKENEMGKTAAQGWEIVKLIYISLKTDTTTEKTQLNTSNHN